MSKNELTWQATAAANLLDARKKRRLLGGTKSRGGCLTCKRRHVKCDESRPYCTKCRSMDMQCDGYGEPSVKPKGSSFLVGAQLLQSMDLHQSDRRPLDFFLSRAAPRLAGSFDREFWCRSILQIAQSESVVLDSLLAISTLYEHPQYMATFRRGLRTTRFAVEGASGKRILKHEGDVIPMDAHHVRALKLYNRAIQGLQQRIKDGKATVLLALVSCVLFICIETIRDHVFAAMSLFEEGVKMLNQLSPASTEPNQPEILVHVRQMFTRLGVLATFLGRPTSTVQQPDRKSYSCGYVFQNLAEARVEIFALLEDSKAFALATDEWRQVLFEAWEQGQLFENPGNEKVSDVLKNKQPVSIDAQALNRLSAWFADECPNESATMPEQAGFEDSHSNKFRARAQLPPFSEQCEHQNNYLQKLARWRQAFDPFCKMCAPTESGSLSYLWMLYYTSLIWISTRLSVDKTAYDTYTPEFRELLEHAETYLKSSASDRPVFTFDIGTAPSLFFTATECRVPSLRRKALALLRKGPRKESILGTDSSAELASRLISLEERDLGLPDPTVYDGQHYAAKIEDTILPSGNRRWHSMEVIKNRLTLSFDVRVSTHDLSKGFLERKFEDLAI